MPTRDDVARLARVSTATVSRAWNTPSAVSPDKLRRIRAAAEKLAWVPDKHASALRRSGSGSVAFLEPQAGWPSDKERHYAWFYARIIRAVKTVLDASPWHLLLVTAGTPAEIRALKTQCVCDGIVSHGISDPGLMTAIRRTGLPHVACWRNVDPAFSSVGVDEVHNGRIVGERFLFAGLSKPAHITGELKRLSVCRERLQGFREIFRGRGMPVLDGELGIRGGYDSARKLIPDIRSGKVDSLFVVNDLTAVGALQAFQEAGIRVPEDLSVIGNGNLPVLDTLPVRLTTVDERLDAVYARAAEIVLELLREPRLVRELVKPILVEGGSVRPARRSSR